MPVVLLLKEAGELDEHGNLPADTTLPDFVKEYASRRITNGVSPYRQYILGEDRRKSKVSEYREIGDWKGLLFLPNIQQDEIDRPDLKRWLSEIRPQLADRDQLEQTAYKRAVCILDLSLRSSS